MMQIKLGARRDIDPDIDPMGRSFVGGYEGMSEANAWLSGRGVWKFNADRALSEETAQVITDQGTIVAVATITGITKHGDRYALEGDLLAGDRRVGQPSNHPHTSRNPIAYF